MSPFRNVCCYLHSAISSLHSAETADAQTLLLSLLVLVLRKMHQVSSVHFKLNHKQFFHRLYNNVAALTENIYLLLLYKMLYKSLEPSLRFSCMFVI